MIGNEQTALARKAESHDTEFFPAYETTAPQELSTEDAWHADI
jgi:hypothetical protein